MHLAMRLCLEALCLALTKLQNVASKWYLGAECLIANLGLLERFVIPPNLSMV